MCVKWRVGESEPGDHYLCEAGTCEACDQVHAELVQVDQDTADIFFGNYTVYFRAADGRIAYRSWWTEVDGRLHHRPRSPELWLRQSAIDHRRRSREARGITDSGL